MSIDVKIHDAQTSILRELLFVREAGYAQMQKGTGLSSDHFNFHIGKLVELGLVEKIARGKYALTTKGKEYANKLDTDNKTIERQPKVAVLLGVMAEINGEPQVLFQQRRKNPYYGYWGFPTGKVRFGETIIEAAARELKEETSLEADFERLGIYKELTHMDTGELLEDKLFCVVRCTNVRGELLSEFEGGLNVWMTQAEARKLEKRYASFETELKMIHSPSGQFLEEEHRYTKSEF